MKQMLALYMEVATSKEVLIILNLLLLHMTPA